MKVILTEKDFKKYIGSMVNEIYDASTDENNKEQYVIFDRNSHKMIHWGSKDACRNMYDHTESFKNNKDIRVMRACDARKIVNSKEDVNESRIKKLVREAIEESFCEYEDAEDRFASQQMDGRDYYAEETWVIRVGDNEWDTEKVGYYDSKEDAEEEANYLREKYPNLYVTIDVEKSNKIISESGRGSFHSQKLYSLFNKYGKPNHTSMDALTYATDDNVVLLSPEQYQDMIRINPEDVDNSARQYLLSHGYNIKSTDYISCDYFRTGSDTLNFILITPNGKEYFEKSWNLRDKRGREPFKKDGATDYYGTMSSRDFNYAKTNPKFRQQLMARYK